jgi:hypothetical protein
MATMVRHTYAVVVAAALAAGAAGCGGESTASPPGDVIEAVSPVPAEPTTTPVPRREPSATPTPEPDPMAPVSSSHVPGVVIPYSAEVALVDAEQTGSDPAAASDLLVEYLIPDADDDALRAWFTEHMPAAGWDEGEDRDGALIFRHRTERSQRGDPDEPMRVVTIFFGLSDGASVSIVAEPPPPP